MSEEAALPCGDPPRRWWQPGRLLNADVGRPPLPRWMDAERLQGGLAAGSWPLFVPFISGPVQRPSRRISEEQHTWRVDLDVAHFSPADITVSVRRGFLEVEGKHGERPDEYGFTARCFTRKYRLPSDVDAARMTSTLSVDGILTVEAPLPEASVPAAVIVPIKVEIETEESPETDQDSSRAPEAQRLLGMREPEDHGKDSPLEVHGDKAPPGSGTAELQQHEESREQEEETREKPAGESHPSVSADGGDTESCQGSSEHREATESQESPDALTPREPEHEEPAENRESRVPADPGEAAERVSPPREPELGESQAGEVQSQELQVPDTGGAE